MTQRCDFSLLILLHLTPSTAAVIISMVARSHFTTDINMICNIQFVRRGVIRLLNALFFNSLLISYIKSQHISYFCSKSPLYPLFKLHLSDYILVFG